MNTIFIKLFALAVFLSFFNVGSVKGASPPGGLDNLPPQANRSSTELGKSRDQSWLEDQEDKNERFKELEWLIKQNLLMQYQRIEIKEDLEDIPD